MGCSQFGSKCFGTVRVNTPFDMESVSTHLPLVLLVPQGLAEFGFFFALQSRNLLTSLLATRVVATQPATCSF